MKRTNFYVTGDGATWRFTKAEFRRQLKNVANGGYIDVDKGTRVAENMVRKRSRSGEGLAGRGRQRRDLVVLNDVYR